MWIDNEGASNEDTKKCSERSKKTLRQSSIILQSRGECVTDVPDYKKKIEQINEERFPACTALYEENKVQESRRHISSTENFGISRAQEYEELNVMSRKPWVSFYSDSRCTSLPYAPSIEVINFARLYDVDYIVIDERLLNKWDVFWDLIRMEKYSDAVEIVYEDNSNKLIKLFRLKK